MIIGALQRFSLIDYPGKICAIVFTQGCNFNCPYCHNPELVLPEFYSPGIAESEVLRFLEKRRGKLDAITITGGEPTLQPDLAEFVASVKKMGYAVKLDTNGSRPEVIRDLIAKGLLDYIAMDIKAPLNKYSQVTRTEINRNNIEISIDLIRHAGIDHEFRTTLVKSLIDERDVFEIARTLTGPYQGQEIYVLQKFIPNKPIDSTLGSKPGYTDQDLLRIKTDLEKIIPILAVR